MKAVTKFVMIVQLFLFSGQSYASAQGGSVYTACLINEFGMRWSALSCPDIPENTPRASIKANNECRKYLVDEISQAQMGRSDTIAREQVMNQIHLAASSQLIALSAKRIQECGLKGSLLMNPVSKILSYSERP